MYYCSQYHYRTSLLPCSSLALMSALRCSHPVPAMSSVSLVDTADIHILTAPHLYLQPLCFSAHSAAHWLFLLDDPQSCITQNIKACLSTAFSLIFPSFFLLLENGIEVDQTDQRMSTSTRKGDNSKFRNGPRSADKLKPDGSKTEEELAQK